VASPRQVPGSTVQTNCNVSGDAGGFEVGVGSGIGVEIGGGLEVDSEVVVESDVGAGVRAGAVTAPAQPVTIERKSANTRSLAPNIPLPFFPWVAIFACITGYYSFFAHKEQGNIGFDSVSFVHAFPAQMGLVSWQALDFAPKVSSQVSLFRQQETRQSPDRFGTYHKAACSYTLHAGRTQSTKGPRPWKLVHTETYETLSAARQRERQIKSWKNTGYMVQALGLDR